MYLKCRTTIKVIIRCYHNKNIRLTVQREAADHLMVAHREMNTLLSVNTRGAAAHEPFSGYYAVFINSASSASVKLQHQAANDYSIHISCWIKTRGEKRSI